MLKILAKNVLQPGVKFGGGSQGTQLPLERIFVLSIPYKK